MLALLEVCTALLLLYFIPQTLRLWLLYCYCVRWHINTMLAMTILWNWFHKYMEEVKLCLNKTISLILQHHSFTPARKTWISGGAFEAFWSTRTFSRDFTIPIRCLKKHTSYQFISITLLLINLNRYNNDNNKLVTWSLLQYTNSKVAPGLSDKSFIITCIILCQYG